MDLYSHLIQSLPICKEDKSLSPFETQAAVILDNALKLKYGLAVSSAKMLLMETHHLFLSGHSKTTWGFG